MSRRPIIKVRQGGNLQQGEEGEQRLCELRKALNSNLKAQERLRKMRDDISMRLHNLDEFISTYRLRLQHPPSTSILSYLKFERNTPHSLKEQSRVLELQEAIKNTNQEDFEFMKKLNEDKPTRKRKEIVVSQLGSDPRKINFIELALSSPRYKTGIDLYKAWLQCHRVKAPKRPYTNRQEAIIIEKQRVYRDNWEKICQFVEGRTFEEVYYEFHNRINPRMHTGRWTLRETLMLIILLEHYGVKKWAQIAQKMGVKSQLQVRERFCNIVNPTLGKNLWTVEMENKLMEVAADHKYSWRQIAKLAFFGNKTDNCVWRKYRNLMIKKSKEEILEEMRNCTKKDLVDKIIAYKELTDGKRRRAELKLQEKREQQERRHAQLLAMGKSPRPLPISVIVQNSPNEQKVELKEQASESVEMEMRMEPDERMIYMMY